jgi:hypothetical protein
MLTVLQLPEEPAQNEKWFKKTKVRFFKMVQQQINKLKRD